MKMNDLVDYWKRMDHSKERLAVMPDQLLAFIDESTWDDTPLHLDIERPDGGVYYIKARG